MNNTTNNPEIWNLLVKLRDNTSDQFVIERCNMYLGQINTSGGLPVKKEAESFLRKFDMLPVIFETGATSHAVNDLILFTDNTRELAELRDDIYKMMWQFDLMGDVKKWNNERFQKLLNKARAAYSNEFGGDNSLHIINMTDAEKIEYRQLYMNDFENWKSEHGYK